MDDEERTTVPDTCQRMIVDPEDGIPESYDKDECQDCTDFHCKFMPPGMEEEFWEGEREMMYGDESDDGTDIGEMFE